MDLLIEKANVLGISDAEYMTEQELRYEVHYQSLSPAGRCSEDYTKKRPVVCGISRTCLPDPIYIPCGKSVVRKRR